LPVLGNESGGASVLISTPPEFKRLAEMITNKPLEEKEKVDDLAVSVIKETANIIGGTFFSLISNTIEVSLVQAVPEFVEGTAEEVISLTLAKLDAKIRNDAVTFEIDFSLKINDGVAKSITTHYVFILGFESGQKLLSKMAE